MSNCYDWRRSRERFIRTADAPAQRRQTELYVYSDIAQILEHDQNVCFNMVSVKRGDILFCCGCIEILVDGTYLIEFASMTEQELALALTVNNAILPGVVYKDLSALNVGTVTVDLRRGDKIALCNKFSVNTLTMKENVINTFRNANASLSVVLL